MNENFEEKIVDTQTTIDEEPKVEPQQPTTTQELNVNEPKVETKTFTQDEVNEIVKKRLDKHTNSTLKQYNLESLEELESLLTKGREYQKLFEELEQLKNQNKELVEKDLFSTNKIDENRFDDVRTYFKGKELDMTAESLAQALATHPEWVKKIAQVEIGAEKQEKNLQKNGLKRQKFDRKRKNHVKKCFGT